MTNDPLPAEPLPEPEVIGRYTIRHAPCRVAVYDEAGRLASAAIVSDHCTRDEALAWMRALIEHSLRGDA